MPFTAGEVANYAVRVFLERVGRRYDEMRGLKRFNDRDPDAIQTIARYFGNSCPYCEGPLTGLSSDHLVPTNMTSVGLHAWGNVVWACAPCNNRKRAQDWRVFLRSVSTDEEFTRRATRIEDFQRSYRYDAGTALAQIAGELHQEVKSLIDQKFKKAESLVSALGRLEVAPNSDAGHASDEPS